MADSPMLVLGATGGQGGAVTNALLARGARVRALVRTADRAQTPWLSERGIETAVGSLDDADSLTAAMDGVAGVFALTTPFEAGPEAEVVQGKAIIAAARRARVGHLVFSSVASATSATGVPHFASKALVETELGASEVPHTVLGPTYFFDNALAAVDRLRDGVLELPLPSDRPLQQLARADLGAFAAEVLLNPAPYGGRRIELASDAPTPTRMAEALSEALGREIRHERTPPAAIGDPDMRAMWDFLGGPGYQVDVAGLHAAHPEVRWTSYEEWARSQPWTH